MIRSIRSDEHSFLEQMFYEALFVPPGSEPFKKSIIYEPHLFKYMAEWGKRSNDICLVGAVNNQPIGAVWGRMFKANEGTYGFVNENTPEIGIALLKEFRGKGIGSKLLSAIEAEYLKFKTRSLSLSVDVRNPAYQLYKRIGYEVVIRDQESATLCKHLV